MANWSNVASASFRTPYWSNVAATSFTTSSGAIELTVDPLSGAAVLQSVAVTPRTPVTVDPLSGPAALQSTSVVSHIPVTVEDLYGGAVLSSIDVTLPTLVDITPLAAVAEMPGVQLLAVHFIPIFHNTPRLAKMAAVQVTVPLNPTLLVQSSTSTAVSSATTLTPHIPIGIDALTAVAALGNTTQQPRFVVFNVDGDNKVNDEQQQVVIAVAAAGTEVGRVFWGGIEQPVYSWSDEEIIVTAAEAGLLPIGELYRWEVWKPNG